MDYDGLEAFLGTSLSRAPLTITPMLLQSYSGRQSCVDYVNGFIVRRGAELGIPTPMHEKVIAEVKEITEKRRLAIEARVFEKASKAKEASNAKRRKEIEAIKKAGDAKKAARKEVAREMARREAAALGKPVKKPREADRVERQEVAKSKDAATE
jgi:hypothetical protein